MVTFKADRKDFTGKTSEEKANMVIKQNCI